VIYMMILGGSVKAEERGFGVVEGERARVTMNDATVVVVLCSSSCCAHRCDSCLSCEPARASVSTNKPINKIYTPA